MKKHIILVLILVATISCADTKKSKIKKGNKIDQSQNDSFLSAKVNGVSFYTDAPLYYTAQNIITVSAVNKDDTEKIRIYINYSNRPATYSFGKGISNSDNMVYTKNKVDWLAAKTDGEGSITVTEEDEYLKARFSFIRVNKETKKKIQITDGEFKVKIKS